MTGNVVLRWTCRAPAFGAVAQRHPRIARDTAERAALWLVRTIIFMIVFQISPIQTYAKEAKRFHNGHARRHARDLAVTADTSSERNLLDNLTNDISPLQFQKQLRDSVITFKYYRPFVYFILRKRNCGRNRYHCNLIWIIIHLMDSECKSCISRDLAS